MKVTIEYRTAFYGFAGTDWSFISKATAEDEVKSWHVVDGCLKCVTKNGDTTYYPLTSIIRWTVRK